MNSRNVVSIIKRGLNLEREPLLCAADSLCGNRVLSGGKADHLQVPCLVGFRILFASIGSLEGSFFL
jgi:hypothetical protein